MNFRTAYTIAQSTHRELIRSKILYTLFLFAFLVVGTSALFGSVTIGDQTQVIKDFGFFAISIFAVGFTVVSGSFLLHKELAKKTIFTLLARPVSRSEFLTGKLFGMYYTVLIMIALMGLGLSCFVALFEGSFPLPLFLGYYHIMLELFIVSSSVIFFSSLVVTPVLIGLFSFGLFLTGRSIEVLLQLTSENGEGATSTFFNFLYWILPQLSTIAVQDAIVHGESIAISQTAWATVYAFSYGLILLLFAKFLFQKREFN